MPLGALNNGTPLTFTMLPIQLYNVYPNANDFKAALRLATKDIKKC